MVFSAGTLPSGTSQGSLLASEAGDPSGYARASPSCPAEPCGSLHPPPGPSVPAPWNVKVCFKIFEDPRKAVLTQSKTNDS
ncbi:hypothetical protein VULLAG_LOCUS21730 [Vulpes lagopus]